MSKIISIWSRKGGVGKSTLSLNLAAAATAKGKNVLLVDSDKQHSCMFVASFNQLPFDVKANLSPKHNYDLIIQDCAPNLDSLPMGNTVIVPFGASGIDIGSVKKFIPMLKAKNKVVLEVVAKVNWQRKEPRTFAIAKQEQGAFIVRDRAIYLKAGNKATTIFDERFKRAYKVNEARAEIYQLLDKALEV